MADPHPLASYLGYNADKAELFICPISGRPILAFSSSGVGESQHRGRAQKAVEIELKRAKGPTKVWIAQDEIEE
jgi:hypothetical protein